MIEKLIGWYNSNKRDLPWRETKDPYKIWVSEIILQQTRVDQGMPYYQRFLKAFPSVDNLASANQDQVLKLWEGLGYYSRARNMHETAKRVVDDFGGTFPSDYEEIKSLKGVGDYTAAAIGSISFGIPKAAVDGNVLRVVSRLTGSRKSIDDLKTRKEITSLLDELIPKTNPSDFNQAMMELGARICTPKKWKCEECPVSEGCVARSETIQSELPVRTKKIKKRIRYFVYLVHQQNGKTIVQQRGAGDVWQGLFEFPLVEVSAAEFENPANQIAQFLNENTALQISQSFKHILTHQTIHAVFLKGSFNTKSLGSQSINWVELPDLALPKLILNYLNSEF